MADYEVGDSVAVSDVSLNRFEIREDEHSDGAKTIGIVEVPSRGKPVAVVEEWGNRSGDRTDLLGGNP